VDISKTTAQRTRDVCGRHDREKAWALHVGLGGRWRGAFSFRPVDMPQTWGVQKRDDKRLGFWADAKGVAGALFGCQWALPWFRLMRGLSLSVVAPDLLLLLCPYACVVVWSAPATPTPNHCLGYIVTQTHVPLCISKRIGKRRDYTASTLVSYPWSIFVTSNWDECCSQWDYPS
jgi:hypothetical protein